MKFLLILPLLAIGVLAKPHNEAMDKCSICTSVVTLVEEGGQAGLNALNNYINGLCNNTGGFSSTCKMLMNDLVQAVQNLLNTDPNLTPDALCVKINMCSSSPQARRVKKVAQKPKKFSLGVLINPHNEAMDECSVCTSVVTLVEEGGQAGLNALNNYIDNLCKSTGGFDSTCEMLMDDLVKAVQNLINTDPTLSPDALCQKMNMCSSSPQARRVKKVARKHKNSPLVGTNSEICDVCMGAANALVDELSEPNVEAAIQKALLAVCNIVPSSERDMCNMVIQNYFGALWSQVLSYLNAKEICTLCKLC